MTNEELAIQIQLGKAEYYAELWERVRLLMYKLLHSRLSGVELPNYITREDMEQEGTADIASFALIISAVRNTYIP